MKNIFFVFTCLILFSLSGCEKSTFPKRAKGILRSPGIDGCNWLVELKDHSYLEPQNLRDFDISLSDGKHVLITYSEIQSGSICMMGTTVKLLTVKAKE